MEPALKRSERFSKLGGRSWPPSLGEVNLGEGSARGWKGSRGERGAKGDQKKIYSHRELSREERLFWRAGPGEGEAAGKRGRGAAAAAGRPPSRMVRVEGRRIHPSRGSESRVGGFVESRLRVRYPGHWACRPSSRARRCRSDGPDLPPWGFPSTRSHLPRGGGVRGGDRTF